jgi:hypothetical protein
MLEQLEKAASEFLAIARIAGPTNSNRYVEVFNLPKNLTTTLVTGYSIPMRWMELESKAPTAPWFL